MMKNRKTATKVLLINWSRFQNDPIRLEGSTLFTGVNGSGKSTVLDAMTYLLTGNQQFNKAAKDRDRTVKAYVRGDTKSNGPMRYLRTGQVVSYLAMEFYSPAEEETLVGGVCIESQDEVSSPISSWFVCKNSRIEDFNFARTEGKTLLVTPKSALTCKNVKLKSADFMGKERGTQQLLRALGLRCDVGKYRSKLVKMMAFNPENNIDQFIAECVLEPGTVNSLEELRQQRDQFEKLKQLYMDLRNGKTKLEEIEVRIRDYETRRQNLDVRELMLCYQELMVKQEEEKDSKYRLAALENKVAELKRQKEALQQQFEDVRKRLQIAESNDVYRGMQDSIAAMESQIQNLQEQIRRQQDQTAKLLKLQILLSEEVAWLLTDWEEEGRKYLLHLSDSHFSRDKKRKALLSFFAEVSRLREELVEEKVHRKDRLQENQNRMAKLEQQWKLLESNRQIYPEEIVQAKNLIAEEFANRGIKSEVRMFAELVQSVRDPSWRKAIETFLGRKRYFLIVNGTDCHAAMEILQERKIHAATVVITDKLPDTQIEPGSAAEQLNIPNTFARRYANYLLNGLHLCDTLEELHDHPKGGLMKNGMLAKSYAVSCMNMKKTELCLGQDTIELRKKSIAEEKKQCEQDCLADMKILSEIQTRADQLQAIDTRMEEYDLSAPELLEQNQEKVKQCGQTIQQMKENPDFIAVLKEQEEAKAAFIQVDNERRQMDQQDGAWQNMIKQEQQLQKQIAGEIYTCQQKYEESRIKHLELEETMLKEYERMSKRRGEVRVLSEKTVQNLRTELDNSIRALENDQLEYCRIAEIDINKRGIGYIPFYRQEYQNVANVKIEEAHNRLEIQSQKLESAFMNDFVAEMNETITEARKEIDAINRELKQIPFGQDTYKFKMEEKADRMLFFHICKKLENYMDSPEVYMNSGREDEEMERDIREFIDLILKEEDEEEYTDYRKYFTYDMEITSRQGDAEIVADLSKKQGSASNGEKQTPYFIILAASLLQCYPRNSCCARLAFIDEAFSALSRERIEQMVKYLEENDFQVIYAAPPEKIGSIGQFINSTVSLVPVGRYTKAVEGLVKNHETNR